MLFVLIKYILSFYRISMCSYKSLNILKVILESLRDLSFYKIIKKTERERDSFSFSFFQLLYKN